MMFDNYKLAFRRLSLLWVAILLIALPAYSQNTTGSLVGTVSDPTGAAVSNATITATNAATSEKRTTTTTDSGEYQILNLQPGQYSLDIESTGFKRYTRSTVEIQVEQATRINAQMVIGAVTEQVTITSAAPIIQSENAALGQVVQGRAVTEIPLNGRNVLALVGLVPGVVPQGSSGGNLTGQNVFAAGNYQIGGGSANQSSTLYDGAPVNISYGNITSLVPSQDAVQEFRVQTNNNTADYGMYTGGVVNMTSKSGGNAIHGTVYEFVRNTIFNSTPYFAKHTNNPANVLAKNPYHQNQFGGNIGFPIIKDKLFGFFDYQGYRQAQKRLYNYTVPTLKMRQGDFSELGVQIYDPCGGTVAGGQGCPNYTGPRTPYPGNIIPAGRWSTVARNLVAFPYWAAPTSSAVTNNFVRYAGSGGNNDQYSGRVDFSLSDKQRLFGRYTQWNSGNIGAMPFNNGLIGGDPISPESFKTRQIVFGDTYLFNPTLIGDLRLSYLRWTYVRTPGTLGFNEPSLGFPGYMGTISGLNGVPNSTTVPSIALANPTVNAVGTGYIFGTNQNYVIAPSVSKTIRGHTIKAGADLRRLEMLYFQNNSPGGSFAFDPNMSASAASGATATSGHPFASFLMGYMVNQANTASVVQIAPPTYNTIYYQGYYVQDNWTITPKLTINIGLRYEIPGVYRERHQLLATFNPNEINPVLGAVSVNGRPVTGAYDLVNSPQHPAVGLRSEHFTNFSPRIGLAFRLNEKTVIRAGWGKFVIPSTLQFPESSAQSPLSYITNNPVSTLDNGATPSATLDNPLPSGITGAPGRNANYQRLLLGGSANTLLQDEANGATYQWNFAVQRQLPLGIALEAAYAGLHGSNLPISVSINQVTKNFLDQAHSDPTCFPNANTAPTANCFLTKTVPNPFDRSKFAQGNQQYSTISSVQLYRPFPQYGGINNTGHYVGVSNYNALQAKLEKRFNSGGVLLGSYSFSKLMGNAESLTSWLETVGAPGYQNTNNLDGEYALSGYDARQRLTVSYVYNLPIGRGQHFLAGVTGVMDKLVSGWGVNGVSTFQKGFPMGITHSSGYVGTYSGTGSTRPNVVASCDKQTHGPVQSRLGDAFSANKYFNTGCFTSPDRFTFGNESRTDNQLRLPGIANWDLALFKDTHVTERVVLQLRVESFNLFNRVQFAGPNTSIGSTQQGQITAQANDPRLLQLAGRINF
ncbi:TonB-dependent receptor [Granulicella sp. dw_53]|uniref:TonB-dependent receptor n=1 Tax=Granulicella sp. dw_53 TaxID=2719792 RepID=UPI001BD5AE58|nr:TonB-dependent receptor [Granulicella sp. dw_53]